MTKKTLLWAALLTLVGPTATEAQQDPAKIGAGAQVYATTCARCHNARSGPERTDLEWVAIVAHMRARANLTKSQADVVLVFLQATNLPEGGGGQDAQDSDDTSVAQSIYLRVNTIMSPALAALLANRHVTRAQPTKQAPTGGGRR